MKTHVSRRILYLCIYLESGHAWHLPCSMPRESNVCFQFLDLYLIEDYIFVCCMLFIYEINIFVLSWITVSKVTGC